MHLAIPHLREELDAVTPLRRYAIRHEGVTSVGAHWNGTLFCWRTNDERSRRTSSRNGDAVIVQVDRHLLRGNDELDGHLARGDCNAALAGHAGAVTPSEWSNHRKHERERKAFEYVQSFHDPSSAKRRAAPRRGRPLASCAGGTVPLRGG